MCPHGYYTLMRESKDPRYLRLRLVQQAKRIGIKPTARLFAVTPNTVRKWLARYDGTLGSLQDRSRAPKHRPRKLPAKDERKILAAKNKLPIAGARRLKLQAPHHPAGPVSIPVRCRDRARFDGDRVFFGAVQ